MRRAARAFLVFAPFAVSLAIWPARADVALAQTADVGPGRETPPALPGDTLRVPQDAPTIQAAVDRGEPGGLILLSPGVYEETVTVTTPFLTIRGADRNEVVLDGGATLANGISVIEADGVAIENLTVRNYARDGLVWTGVFGYRASFVTAYDNGDHGLVSYGSRFGRFERSYASGHPDSGFAVVGCQPCDAVVTDVIAEHNAIGFAATNASGALFVVNSEWRDNMSGISPSTLGSDPLATQPGIVIAGNWVHDNNDADAPAEAVRASSIGIGILVSGGRDDLVTQNLVEGHERFGIAVLASTDGDVRLSQENEIRDNVVRGSGNADLALGWPSAGGDCFSGNAFTSSLPVAIEWRHGCGSWLRDAAGGSLGASVGPLVRSLWGELPDVGDRRERPRPTPQEPMANADTAPPFPAIAGTAVPGAFTIRDARTLDVSASTDVSQEVTVLGLPLATTWWGILVGLYAYALPLVLYSAWISIALWDLVRQEAVPNRTRIAWMAAVIAVPVVGPIAYYAFGRSPIQPSLRIMLVGGGVAIYVTLAVVSVVFGA